MSSMAGDQGGQQPTPGSGGSKLSAVTEKLMGAEKLLRDAASIMPEIAPVIDDVTQRLRAGAGKIIINSAQAGGSPPPSPSVPMAGMMGGGPPTGGQ